MGKVSIVRTNNAIKQSLACALDLLGGLERFIDKSDRVMLKPNLNGAEGCTDREMVESLIQLLADFDVRRIFIAESTFGDKRNTDMLFKQTGFDLLAKKYNINLINLNASEVVEVQVENPMALARLQIAREFFEADKIINLPNMKVHYATGITLALKNLKGILVGEQKKRFHEIGLDKAIVDLNQTVRAQLNIVDCIRCMERMGPRGGDMVDLNLIMAGEHAAEVDYVGRRVMGYELDEVKHLQYYMERNAIDPGAIEVIGEEIRDVQYPFKKVQLANIVSEKFRIHSHNACSACMNAFLLSCSLLGGEVTTAIDVYLGSAMDNKSSENLKLAFGNCCPKDKNFDINIKGCPPYPFTLKERLKDYLDPE